MVEERTAAYVKEEYFRIRDLIQSRSFWEMGEGERDSIVADLQEAAGRVPKDDPEAGLIESVVLKLGFEYRARKAIERGPGD